MNLWRFGATALVVVAAIGLVALLGYWIAQANDDQPGTPVSKDSGIHIDTTDDWGLHVREVVISGQTCYVATLEGGVGIDCPERRTP